MNYIDLVHNATDFPIDSQVIGIIIRVPIIGFDERELDQINNKCEKCERIAKPSEKFCSNCGGKNIETIESCIYTQIIPIPDLRKDMNVFGVKKYAPFNEEIEKEKYWNFIYKEYFVIESRNSFEPFIYNINLKQVNIDIELAKDIFKNIIKRHKAEVNFSVIGIHRG